MFTVRCLRHVAGCRTFIQPIPVKSFCKFTTRCMLNEIKIPQQVSAPRARYCTFSSHTSTQESSETAEFEKVADGDESVLKKLRVLALEVELWRQEGLRIPSRLEHDHWKELLSLETRSQRYKQLMFWWTKEKRKESDRKKKEIKQKESEERKAQAQVEKESNPHIHYGFGGSTIFIRIYDNKIDQMNNNRLIQAMQFGQNLVVDCSYDRFMTIKEASNCAKQLMILFSDNRSHDEPFNLHFCNANPESTVLKKLNKHIPTLYDDWFPLNVTEESYLDLFPKDRLVYLTPHCREELKTYSHDDIYIIGAMVDKVNNEPLSLAKAKTEGLRMAKLPLDRYLRWGIGSKSLTLDQMIKIMLNMKQTGDWEKSLVHVPKRKIFEHEDVALELSQRRVNPIRKKRKSLFISSLYS